MNPAPRHPPGGAWQRSITHCPLGHPYDAANTYIRKDRPGARECRSCNLAAAHRHATRKRMERV